MGLMYVLLLKKAVGSLFSDHWSFRIASSFVAVVKALVSDIILPPLSLIPFVSRSIEEKFLILKQGHGSIERYNTRAQAIEDGAVILSYGYALSVLGVLSP